MRLFIAVTFDDSVLDGLEELTAACRRLGRGSWSRRDNLHLTLEFLGELPDTAAAEAAMDALTAPAFRLTLSHLGFFRRPEGDVLWMGAEPCPALTDMQRRLHGLLLNQGLRLERRPFRPHLTLGRRVRLEQLPPCPTLVQPVTGISLMESSRPGGVLTYTERYWRRLED